MISPKVYIPLLISIVAAVVLMLITGDDTYLVTILIGLIAAGGGYAANPAPGVTMEEIERYVPPSERNPGS